MPIIYYTYYTPVSSSVTAVSNQEHRLGRQLLAAGLNNLFGLSVPKDLPPDFVQLKPGGKPFLPDHPEIFFNITHCKGLAACAFHHHPIGIDAELPGYFPEILIRRALAEPEQQILQVRGRTPALRQEWFYRLWTLKEAYVKCSGTGVDTDLTAFSFTFTQQKSGAPKILCSDSSVQVFQHQLNRGQVLSICCKPPVDRFSWVELPL